MARSRLYEDAFLQQVAAAAQQAAGVDVTHFISAVQHRLEVGAREYGDNNFMRPNWPGWAEIRQEPPDTVAWALLILQRLENQDTAEVDGQVHQHLFQASVLQAMADWHVRQAQLAARGAI